MKPWISALTWSFPRLIAPVRRSFHAAFDVAKKLEKQGEFVSAKGVQSNGMRLRTKLKESPLQLNYWWHWTDMSLPREKRMMH